MSSNLGYTGYLLRKTVQPHSLRNENNANFNEFREKNMLLYITKKVSHTREREGQHLTAQQMQKGIHLLSRRGNAGGGGGDDDDNYGGAEEKADLVQLKKEDERDKHDPFYKDIMLKMKEGEFIDDFAIVSEENKVSRSNQSKKYRSDIEQTLNVLVANNLDQTRIKELFRDYKKVSLKDKLNDLKSRHLDMAKIQSRIKRGQHKMQDLEDVEKVNKFMGQICNSKGLTIGTVLQINEEDIDYEEENTLLDQIPKAKALQMLEELMEDQEEENKKTLIKIFKKSQLDNIDADAARNKYNMTSFKKKNEQTEKLYQQMAQNNKKALLNAMKDPMMDPEKFARKKNTVKPPSEKVNVFKRLTSEQISNLKKSGPTNFNVSESSLITQQDLSHKKLEEEFLKRRGIHSFAYVDHTQPSQEIKEVFHRKSTSNPKFLKLNSQSQSIFSVTTGSQFQSLASKSHPITAKASIFQFSNTHLQSSNHQFSNHSETNNLNVEKEDRPEIQKRPLKGSQTSKAENNRRNSMTSSIEEEEYFIDDQKEEIQQLRFRIQKLKKNNQNIRAKELQRVLDKILIQRQVAEFVFECDIAKKEATRSSIKASDRIKKLEEIIDDQLKEIRQQQHGDINVESKLENPQFIEFIKRAEFKRKLTNYLISKVNKKSDLFSKYQSKQFTSNFFAMINEKEVQEQQPLLEL